LENDYKELYEFNANIIDNEIILKWNSHQILVAIFVYTFILIVF
jgi:hypothetical protein